MISSCKIACSKLVLVLFGSMALMAPALAGGSIGLDEVITAVARSPNLVREIQAELNKNGLRAADVTCSAARHGNQWKYLGGSRAAPYDCDIGKRSITIEAERVYFDPRGRSLGDVDHADPDVAKTFQENNFSWDWTNQ